MNLLSCAKCALVLICGNLLIGTARADLAYVLEREPVSLSAAVDGMETLNSGLQGSPPNWEWNVVGEAGVDAFGMSEIQASGDLLSSSDQMLWDSAFFTGTSNFDLYTGIDSMTRVMPSSFESDFVYQFSAAAIDSMDFPRMDPRNINAKI